MRNEKSLATNKKLPVQVLLLAAAAVLAGALLFTHSTLFARGAGSGQGASSQQTPTRQSITDQEIQLMHADMRAQRRQLVAANLPLTTEESAKFWPVYDQYIAETIKINDVQSALIKDYAANYATLGDAKAAEYIRKTIEIDKAIIDLRVKYIPTVEKVLPERKSAIFFQIDRRAQLIIDMQIASLIPLISPK